MQGETTLDLRKDIKERAAPSPLVVMRKLEGYAGAWLGFVRQTRGAA